MIRAAGDWTRASKPVQDIEVGKISLKDRIAESYGKRNRTPEVMAVSREIVR